MDQIFSWALNQITLPEEMAIAIVSALCVFFFYKMHRGYFKVQHSQGEAIMKSENYLKIGNIISRNSGGTGVYLKNFTNGEIGNIESYDNAGENIKIENTSDDDNKK